MAGADGWGQIEGDRDGSGKIQQPHQRVQGVGGSPRLQAHPGGFSPPGERRAISRASVDPRSIQLTHAGVGMARGVPPIRAIRKRAIRWEWDGPTIV